MRVKGEGAAGVEGAALGGGGVVGDFRFQIWKIKPQIATDSHR
jgi:hypothetical protein